MLSKLDIPGVVRSGQRMMLSDGWLANLDTAKIFVMNDQGKYVLKRYVEDRDLWTDPVRGDTYQNQRGRLLLVLRHTENFLSLCPSKAEQQTGRQPRRSACL
jgi:hypothetical protein